MHATTISQSTQDYLDNVTLARSQNTARTYRNALSAFLVVIEDNGLNPDETAVRDLPEDAVTWFATALKDHAPATEALYLTAAAGFYEYLAAERMAAADSVCPNFRAIRLRKCWNMQISLQIKWRITTMRSCATTGTGLSCSLWPIQGCGCTKSAPCGGETWIGTKAEPL